MIKAYELTTEHKKDKIKRTCLPIPEINAKSDSMSSFLLLTIAVQYCLAFFVLFVIDSSSLNQHFIHQSTCQAISPRRK